MLVENAPGETYEKYSQYGINYVQFGRKRDGKTGRILYATTIKIIDQPTNNCQLTTIGSMANLTGGTYTVDEIVEVLREIESNYLATRCVLVDLEKYAVPKYKEALTKMGIEILAEVDYKNPTGSSMVFIYANFAGDEDEDDEDYYDDEEYYDEDDYSDEY